MRIRANPGCVIILLVLGAAVIALSAALIVGVFI